MFLTTALSYAFTNRKPVVPGHVLVSPLRPVERFADLTSEEVSDLFLCVHRVFPVLQQAHSSPALTIAVQDGREAGQSVQHVHVHLLPRRQGDFARNDDIYDELSRHDKPEMEGSQRFRSEEEMQQEAAHLAKLFTQT